MPKNKKNDASKIEEGIGILNDDSEIRDSFKAKNPHWYRYLNESTLQATNRRSSLVPAPPLLDDRSLSASQAEELKKRRSWWKVLKSEKSIVADFSSRSSTIQNSGLSNDDEDELPLMQRKILFANKNMSRDEIDQSFSAAFSSNSANSKVKRSENVPMKQEETSISSDCTVKLTPIKIKKLFRKPLLNRSSAEFVELSSSEESVPTKSPRKSFSKKSKKIANSKKRENNSSRKNNSSNNFSDSQSEIFIVPSPVKSRKLFRRIKPTHDENSNSERSPLQKSSSFRNKKQDSVNFSAAFETESELSAAEIKKNVLHFSSIIRYSDIESDELPVNVTSEKVLTSASKSYQKKKKLFELRNNSSSVADFENVFEGSSKKSFDNKMNKSKKNLSSISVKRKTTSELSKEITEPLEPILLKKTRYTPVKTSIATIDTDDILEESLSVLEASTTNFDNVKIPSVNSKTQIVSRTERGLSIEHDSAKNIKDLSKSGDKSYKRKKLFEKYKTLSISSNDFNDAFESDNDEASRFESKIISKSPSHNVLKELVVSVEKLKNISGNKSSKSNESSEFCEAFDEISQPKSKKTFDSQLQRQKNNSRTKTEISNQNKEFEEVPVKKSKKVSDTQKNVSLSDSVKKQSQLQRQKNKSTTNPEISNQTKEFEEVPVKKSKKVSDTQKNVSLSDSVKKQRAQFTKKDSSLNRSDESAKALESGAYQLKSIKNSHDITKDLVVRIEKQEELFGVKSNLLNKSKDLNETLESVNDSKAVSKSKPKISTEKTMSKKLNSSAKNSSDIQIKSPVKYLTATKQSKNSNGSETSIKNDSKTSDRQRLLKNAIVEIHTDVTELSTPKKQNKGADEMSDTSYVGSNSDSEMEILSVSKRMKTSKVANVKKKVGVNEPEINVRNASPENKKDMSVSNKSALLSTDAIVFIHSPELVQSARKSSNRKLIPARSTRRTLSFGKTISFENLDLSSIEKIPSKDRSGEKMVLSKSGELDVEKKTVNMKQSPEKTPAKNNSKIDNKNKSTVRKASKKKEKVKQNSEELDKTVETSQKSMRYNFRSAKRKASEEMDANDGHNSAMSFMTVVDQVIRTNKKSVEKGKNSTEMELTEPVNTAVIINKQINSEERKKTSRKSLNSETETPARKSLKFVENPKKKSVQSKIPVLKFLTQTAAERKPAQPESTTKKQLNTSYNTVMNATPIPMVNIVNIPEKSQNSERNATDIKNNQQNLESSSEDENVNYVSGVNSLINLNESFLRTNSSNITPNKKIISKGRIDFDTNGVMTQVHNLTTSPNDKITVSKTKFDKEKDVYSPDRKNTEDDEKSCFKEKNVSIVRPSPRKNKETFIEEDATPRRLLSDYDDNDAIGVAIRKASEQREKRVLEKLAKLKTQKITDYFTAGPARENKAGSSSKRATAVPAAQNTQPKPSTSKAVKKKEFDFNKNSKLYMPKNWVTKRLYKHLIEKLEPKYGEMAKARSIRFVKFIIPIVTTILRRKTYQRELVKDLKRELVRLAIVSTNWEYYNFLWDYMPNDFNDKVIAKMIALSDKTTVPYEHEPLLEPLDYRNI